MINSIAVFKPWVPAWLVKAILFLVILPSMLLFFLPMANINAAAGYYGCEPADIQFSVALFYAGYAGFYCLERRISSFLASKEYFVIFTFLQMLTSFVCYETTSLAVLFPLRFVQGMGFAGMVSLSLSLMFRHLQTEKAREIGFSVFFCFLLCASPFNNLVMADFIDSYNFNIVYKCILFAYMPGMVIVMATMNKVRLNTRVPLYRLNWPDFTLYSLILVLIGYLLIYGQQYYWLDDARIKWSAVAVLVLATIYSFRQIKVKRPYTDLSVITIRNFKIGIILLFVMYICRFASGLTITFFASALKYDPIHVSQINMFNIAGLISGVVISCRMLLKRKKIRFIWIPAFALLLVFHVAMFFLFNTQANPSNYFIPLFIQGAGVGMIMTPTILYAISSVPPSKGTSASALALAVRYLGFCTSIAFINYFSIFEKSRHYNAFQDRLTRLSPIVKQTLTEQTQHLAERELIPGRAAKISIKLLVNRVNGQADLRFAMDYYEIMSWVLVATLLLIAFFPYLNRTIVYLRSRRLSPS